MSLFPYDLVTPAESVGSERLVGASPFFAYPTGLAEGPLPSSSGMLASGSHPASLRRVPPSFESGGKSRPGSAESDPGPHSWGLQPSARLLSSAL